MRLGSSSSRRGAHAVEAAFIYPVVLLLMIGLIIGGIAVFRYNQVANLAREGARWASVHGWSYKHEQNPSNPSPTLTTSAEVYNNAILPKVAGMDTARLSYTITWDDPYQGTVHYNGSAYVPNRVRVSVTYQWMPEAYLVGPINITSTSSAQMVY